MSIAPHIPHQAEPFGEPVRVFRATFVRRLSKVEILLVLGAALLVWGVWLITSSIGFGVVVTGLAILAIGLPMGATLCDARSSARTGCLFEDGFCYIDDKGQVLAARWNEIDRLWVLPLGDNAILTIQKFDGTKFSINDPWLKDYRDFVRAIEEKYAAAKLPGIRRRLDSGAQVSFGPLTMTRTGLIKESYIFPIAELDEVGVECPPERYESYQPDKYPRPRVRIVHKGRSFDWPDLTVADIADFHAMMTVLEEHGKAHQPYY